MNALSALIICPLAATSVGGAGNAGSTDGASSAANIDDANNLAEFDQLSPSPAFDFTVAVDGGAAWFYAQDIVPHFAVGDFDSLDRKTLKWLEASSAKIKRVSSDKEFSDLELALEICEEQNVCSATIIGAIGGRLDHQLCVLGAVNRSALSELTLVCASQSAGKSQVQNVGKDEGSGQNKNQNQSESYRQTIRVLREGQDFTFDSSKSSPIDGSLALDSSSLVDVKTFSVISLQGAVVSISGSRWDLDHKKLEPLSSLGLSNERWSNSATSIPATTANSATPTTITVHEGTALLLY